MLLDIVRRVVVFSLVAAIIGGLWLMAAIKADPMIIGPSFIPRTLMEFQATRSNLPGVPSLQMSFADVERPTANG